MPTLNSDSLDYEKLNEKIETLFYEENFSLAASYAAVALQIIERDSGTTCLSYGNSLDVLGVTLHNAGKLMQALPNLEAGVAHALKYLGKTHEDYITRLSNLGMLYKDLGDHARAVSTLEQAVSLCNTYLSKDNTYYPILINNLGLAFEYLGLYDRAIPYYEEAKEITRASLGTQHPKYAIRLNNLASVIRRAGRNQEALALYQEALAIYEKKPGPFSQSYLDVLANIGRTYHALGKMDTALFTSRRVLSIADKFLTYDHLQFNHYLLDLGACLLTIGSPDSAYIILSAALQNVKKFHPDQYNTLKLIATDLAVTCEKLERHDQAIAYFEEVQHLVNKEINSQFDRLSQKEQYAYFYSHNAFQYDCFYSFAFRHPGIPGLAEMGFNDQLTVKALMLGYQQRLFSALREQPDSPIVHLYNEWLELNSAIAHEYSRPATTRSAQFDSLLNKANELERELAVQSIPFREARKSTNWQDIQAHLRANEAVVEFCKYQYAEGNALTSHFRYVAFILRNSGPPVMVSLFDEAQLANLGATRRLYVFPGKMPASGTLYACIWEPLKTYLEGISTLYYVPSGLIHRINLGAIPVDGQSILSDRFQLHCLGSSRQLLEEDATLVDNKPPTALVFGGIRYDFDSLALAESNTILNLDASGGFYYSKKIRGEEGESWNYLPGTETEAVEVSNLLRQTGTVVSFKTGFEATEAQFKQAALAPRPPAIIHLATHGYFFPDTDTAMANNIASTGIKSSLNPLVRSGVILAGANRVWMGRPSLPGQEDGILTAFEIADLPLETTALVVLSACETGLGDLRGEEGVYGLQRAFKLAGAKYIIMSLWNVQDNVSQEFMKHFYEGWLIKGLSIPDAFYGAQNHLRAKYARPFNPSLWAGFILVE